MVYIKINISREREYRVQYESTEYNTRVQSTIREYRGQYWEYRGQNREYRGQYREYRGLYGEYRGQYREYRVQYENTEYNTRVLSTIREYWVQNR